MQFAWNSQNSRNLVPVKFIPSKELDGVCLSERQMHSKTLKQAYTLKHLYTLELTFFRPSLLNVWIKLTCSDTQTWYPLIPKNNLK